jgi:hypothetical protein
MRKYNVIIGFIDDMGSVPNFTCQSSNSETVEENALWQLNSMRDHDGLPRLKELPYYAKFEVIY